MNRSLVAVTLAVIVCGGAATSFADPITVVSADSARIYIVGGASPYGTINVWQSGSPVTFNILGPVSSTYPVDLLCTPCSSGQTFTPGYQTVGVVGTVSGWLGDPQHPEQRWTDLPLIGRVALSAGSMVLPANAPAVYNVVLPLTFDASLYGATLASWASVVLHVQAFSFPGQALVQFRTSTGVDGDRLFWINSVDYVAEAAPTPEPASLLLVGTVLASCGAFRLRKHRQSAMNNPPITNESRD